MAVLLGPRGNTETACKLPNRRLASLYPCFYIHQSGQLYYLITHSEGSDNPRGDSHLRCELITMTDTDPFSKDSESLLASDSEDEELYVPTRRRMVHGNTIAAALTVFNVAVSLATIVFWLSSPRYDECVPRLAGAGDVQDAIDAHVIEYEVRSYSKPLKYDEVSQKAAIASNGDRNYAGPPSLETDAAWNDLLRGEFLLVL